MAKKAGIDKDTGLHRTGLDEYLKVIFPNIEDWIHDKTLGKINDITYKSRTDYRSETLKLIIEFDGLQHYTKPDIIEKDNRLTKVYEDLGYKVVRIPYFIQLSNNAVKKLFGIDVKEFLFDESIPSLGYKGQNTPAYIYPAGLARMVKVFRDFLEQYKTNFEFLKKQNETFKTGIEFLEIEFNRNHNLV